MYITYGTSNSFKVCMNGLKTSSQAHPEPESTLARSWQKPHRVSPQGSQDDVSNHCPAKLGFTLKSQGVSSLLSKQTRRCPRGPRRHSWWKLLKYFTAAPSRLHSVKPHVEMSSPSEESAPLPSSRDPQNTQQVGRERHLNRSPCHNTRESRAGGGFGREGVHHSSLLGREDDRGPERPDLPGVPDLEESRRPVPPPHTPTPHSGQLSPDALSMDGKRNVTIQRP